MDLLSPPEPPPLPNPKEAAVGALSRPLGQPTLDRFLEPGDRVAVVAPAADEVEALGFALEAVQEAAHRAGVAALGLYAAPDEAAPHDWLGKSSQGVMRALRPIARADKLVVVSRIAFHPLTGLWGGGLSLASVAADRQSLDHLIASGGLQGFLSRLPPAFLLEVAFQRGGRPAALFAGAMESAHIKGGAFWERWRRVPLEAAYEAVIVSAPRPERSAEAILLAARALRPGGTLIYAGPPPATPPPLLASPMEAFLRAHELLLAEDLAAARLLADARAPSGRRAHLPDPLRTLPSIRAAGP